MGSTRRIIANIHSNRKRTSVRIVNEHLRRHGKAFLCCSSWCSIAHLKTTNLAWSGVFLSVPLYFAAFCTKLAFISNEIEATLVYATVGIFAASVLFIILVVFRTNCWSPFGCTLLIDT